MNLALFDFDGTITYNDTFTKFVFFSLPSYRKILGSMILAPFILGYKLGWISATQIRKKIVFVGFAFSRKDRVLRSGQEYAVTVIPKLMRKIALDRIYWHKIQGDKIVVVSASLSVYLQPWCDSIGIELICSELASNGNRLTGKYIDGDCTGKTKAERVISKYDLDTYPAIYAYGDTKEDDEMLNLATEKYFRWERR